MEKIEDEIWKIRRFCREHKIHFQNIDYKMHRDGYTIYLIAESFDYKDIINIACYEKRFTTIRAYTQNHTSIDFFYND